MKRLALLIILTVAGQATAASAEPLVGLTLSINDAASRTVYRGWPLLLIGQAYLSADGNPEVRLDPASLRLVILSERGEPETWPVRRISDGSTAPVLIQQDESMQVRWLLTAEQTRQLRIGAYSATLIWADAKSLPITFTIVDPPAGGGAADKVRKAWLESEAALLQNDPVAALAALSADGAPAMDSIPLLQQRARVHEKQDNPAEVIKATQRAQEIFRQKYPNADQPPFSILTIESRAMAAIVANQPSGTRQVSGGNSAASMPATSAAAAPKSASAPVVPVPQLSPASSAPASNSAGSSAAPVVPASAKSPGGSSSVSLVGAPADGVVVPANELDEAKIRADAVGQWAATAKAGSSYSNPNYGPAKATGAPDVAIAGDSVDAWCPGRQNDGVEWLEVTFANPTQATELRVRQNHNPGAIVKVEAFEADGTSHLWWAGTDPFRAPPIRAVGWFAVRVPVTAYRVAKVRVTLNLAAVSGWKQIDAVQLVGTP